MRPSAFCMSHVRGGNAIYVPYGDVPLIRDTFRPSNPKQGAKFVLSLRARVHLYSTVWYHSVGFNLFVFFLKDNLLRVTMIACRHRQHVTLF